MPAVRRINWPRELAFLAVLFAAGAALLPFAIFFVGQNIIGEYGENAGVSDLLGAIWSDLRRPRIAAWTLVLSPYVVVTLLRVSIRTWRTTRSEIA